MVYYRILIQVVQKSGPILKRILVPDASGPKGSWYRDLAQVIRQGPNASGPKGPDADLDPDAEILQKWSYTILDPDTSGQKDPDTETLRKWSHSILIEVVEKDFETEILHKRSDTMIQVVQKDPDTVILHKWSYRILVQVVQNDPNTEILHKWSYRILIQVVQKDPHTGILKQRSCTYRVVRKGPPYRDPETEILRKCYYRILI